MALMGCVGTRAHEALLHDLVEAVKENALTRLEALLGDGRVGSEEINHKHLLHQAAWLGNPKCVKLLLQYGANPNKFHKKNGCTPLHLCHFCTIEDTNPEETIRALVEAGADINNIGNHKCAQYPIYHAIQHQRLDSVQALLAVGSKVTLQAALIAIDVSNPQILEALLMAGAQCGSALESVLYWGQPLHRVLYSPLKSPKECYKQMFQMIVQATMCRPLVGITSIKEPKRQASNYHLLIESEMRTLSQDSEPSTDLTRYMYVSLLRNGFYPTEAVRTFTKTLHEPDWVDSYLASPVSLKDMCVRVMRSYLMLSGNIMYGASQMKLPSSLQSHILLVNPF